MPPARGRLEKAPPEPPAVEEPLKPVEVESSLHAQLFAEFLGTFLFSFCLGCNVLSKNVVWGGVSVASLLTASIYSLGSISGAHFNPAVSIGFGIVQVMGGKGIGLRKMLMYCAVQVAGSALAGLCYCLAFWNTFDLGPGPGFGFWHIALCETLYTFMLIFVVLNVRSASNNTPNHFYGLAIGFVYVAGAYGAARVSGGCFNPAVAIGIDLASAYLGFGWSFAYLMFEVAGAAFAALVFSIVRPEDFDNGVKGSRVAQLVCEFLGTFMLVLTIGLNVLGKSPAAAYSVGACLMCMAYAVCDVSGAHFNPSVTLAVFLSGRCPEKTPQRTKAKMCMYFGVQIVAAVLGAFTYSTVYGGGSFRLGPGFVGEAWSPIALAEFAFTFLLCYVVLCVTVSKTTKNPSMFGLSMGACITVAGNAIGSITGASLNPAVSLGIAACHRASEGSLFAALYYSLVEILAGVCAAHAFNTTHALDLQEEETIGPPSSA